MIKLIVSDLDHTLLLCNDELSAFAQETLESALQHGIQFVPCSARNYSEIPDWFLKHPDIRYCISNNGALLMDTQEHTVLAQYVLSRSEALEVLEYLERLTPYWSIGIGNQVYMYEKILIDADMLQFSESYLNYIRKYRLFVTDYRDILNQDKPIYKIHGYAGPSANRADIIASLKDRFPHLSVTSSSQRNFELSHPHATKGKAVGLIQNKIDITQEDTAVFGDNMNDISMFSQAKYSYAVANAVDDLKQAARFSIGHHGEDSVAQAIKDIIKKQQE